MTASNTFGIDYVLELLANPLHGDAYDAVRRLIAERDTLADEVKLFAAELEKHGPKILRRLQINGDMWIETSPYSGRYVADLDWVEGVHAGAGFTRQCLLETWPPELWSELASVTVEDMR